MLMGSRAQRSKTGAQRSETGAQRSETGAVGAGRNRIRAIVLGSGFFLGAAVSCTDALPRQAPEGALRQDIELSQRVVAECAQNADAARIERERAEQLLSEARALAARAEEAERACSRTGAQVGDAEKKVQTMFRNAAASKRAAAKRAEEAAAAAAVLPTPTPAPTAAPVLHSPSDAP